MKVLVTGGAGYIGSVVVEKLIESGHDAIVFDNLQQGHRSAVHPKATFVLGDLYDTHHLQGIFLTNHIDAVIHLASNTLVGESSEKPFDYLGTNVICALKLLKTMHKFKCKKFIFSSTANLFLDIGLEKITESSPLAMNSPYGESKYIIERLLWWLNRTIGLKYTALRYFNVAGASENYGEDRNHETHLIPLVLQVAQEKKSHINIFGTDYPTDDGTCIRDYIHVCDLADAHILALESLGDKSQSYNLGNGNGYSVCEVINAVKKITGKEIDAKILPRRIGDPAQLVADSSKIREELGWEPKYTELHDIIETAWQWRQKHPEGYPQ